MNRLLVPSPFLLSLRTLGSGLRREAPSQVCNFQQFRCASSFVSEALHRQLKSSASNIFNTEQVDDDILLGATLLNSSSSSSPSRVMSQKELAQINDDHLNRLVSMIPSSADPFKVADPDIQRLGEDIKNLVGSDHAVLATVARHFFNVSGKRFRPVIVLLLARALCGDRRANGQEIVSNSQRRLAEITELIHTASLMHDDVIDKAETRRGAKSVNAMFGNKTAILAGDFLLARASLCLASLENHQVTSLMSAIIEHLVKGEIMQMSDVESTEPSELLRHYLKKTFYKTSSLIANSCKSVAVLGSHPAPLQQLAFEYGKNVGLAFQLVDDWLDYVSSSQLLGKPALNDLKQGLATAPVLFALEEHPQLRPLVLRKFSQEGDVEEARRLVESSAGLERTRQLALAHTQRAIDCLSPLEASQAKDALVSLAGKVLTRLY